MRMPCMLTRCQSMPLQLWCSLPACETCKHIVQTHRYTAVGPSTDDWHMVKGGGTHSPDDGESSGMQAGSSRHQEQHMHRLVHAWQHGVAVWHACCTHAWHTILIQVHLLHVKWHAVHHACTMNSMHQIDDCSLSSFLVHDAARNKLDAMPKHLPPWLWQQPSWVLLTTTLGALGVTCRPEAQKALLVGERGVTCSRGMSGHSTGQ